MKGLVVCPKAIKDKWKRSLIEEGAVATVVTRDEIKKVDLNALGDIALILDEAQDFASPIFDKGRSDRTEAIYKYIRSHPNAGVLLLTATPVRSTPWNIHTLACFLGVYWDVKMFREKFFHLTDKFGRLHYEKNKDWRIQIRPYIEAIADIVLMNDCFDVPIQHNQIEHVKWTANQENALKGQYLEPAPEWHLRHRLENGKEKFDHLKQVISKYRKVIVVCVYTEQINTYAKEIGEDRQVFVLNGKTKDQDAVIASAQQADDCVFLVQASMGAGFDADQFSVIVFASMSFKYIDYAQMKYRVKRAHNLHENTFIHLIGGKCDQSVYNTINEGKNFDPHEYLAKTPRANRVTNPENHDEYADEINEYLTGSPREEKETRAKRNAGRVKVVPDDVPF